MKGFKKKGFEILPPIKKSKAQEEMNGHCRFYIGETITHIPFGLQGAQAHNPKHFVVQ